MSTEFAFNQFQFGDAAGSGIWLIGHYRQHLRYNGVLAARSPPVLIPSFSILTIEGGNKRAWLDAHASWHNLLRPIANVTGIDLAVVDLDDEREFYSWIDAHNLEHQIMDAVFGVA